jgi:hypothetical protein
MTDLGPRVLAAIARQPSLSRSAVRRRQWLLTSGAAASLAVVYCIFALGIFGWQPIPRSTLVLVGTSLGAAVITVLAVTLVLGRGGCMLGRSRRLLIAVAALVPAALMAWKTTWSAAFGSLDESPRLGYRCLVMSLAMGALPLLLLVLGHRGEEPRHPKLLGAALGVAVGACGWFLVDLWCPVAGVWHLLRGHVPPVVLLGILGAALGSRIAAVRTKS